MALTLTRKVGEVIRFTLKEDLPAGTIVEVEVGEIRRNQVRLKNWAPDTVAIDRQERSLELQAQLEAAQNGRGK